MKKSIIDIGSNTVRLEIYSFENGEKKRILSEKAMIGLVGYIENGYMNDYGVKLLADTLRNQQLICNAIGVEEIYLFATASMRYIKNTAEILKRIKEDFGLHIRMIPGEEEAILGFSGIKKEFPQIQDGVMVDTGGGSSQILCFNMREVMHAFSVPMGSLSSFQKYVKGILTKKKEWDNIQNSVYEHLKGVNWLQNSYENGYVIGGTARAFVKLHRVLYNRLNEAISGYSFQTRDLDTLLEIKREEKLSRYILKSSPDRIHTLLPGCAIISAIFKTAGIQKITVSQSGIREGYWALIEKEG